MAAGQRPTRLRLSGFSLFRGEVSGGDACSCGRKIFARETSRGVFCTGAPFVTPVVVPQTARGQSDEHVLEEL